jgi:hypothetical protein
VGAYSDPTRHHLRLIIDQVGWAKELLSPEDSFFQPRLSIRQEAIERFCPEMAEAIYEPRQNTELEVIRVLDACPNEAMNLTLPSPLGTMIRRPWRAPFEIYATDDAVVYVHPLQYQVLSRDRSGVWESANPRSLSKHSIPDLPLEKIDMNIIVVQDRFEFFNLCHFLFDGLTRVLHFIATFGVSNKDLFVFGSVPSEYHALICASLALHAGVPRESLFFPASALLLSTSRKCFWFSDQVLAHSHPAQMAHPRSLSVLSAFCTQVPSTDSSARRIYISRGDASRRRVANEKKLMAALESVGFISVQLGTLPAAQQIGLFRGADIVVGPHGMGLTHMIMGTRLGRLVELFHPRAGTDAYAFVATVAGIQYDYVVGEDVANQRADFEIDPDRVLDLLGPDDAPVRRPSWNKMANMIPASKTFQGFFAVGANRIEPSADQMIWGQQSRLHYKQGQVEVGRWPDIRVSAGKNYVLSCWVRIPSGFSGTALFLHIKDWQEQTHHEADVGQRDLWQRIYSAGTSPSDGRCQLSLELEGDDGISVISTCWQFENGIAPTSYVPTG